MIKIKGDNTTYITDNDITKEYAVEIRELKKGEKITILSDAMLKTMFQNEERKAYSSKFISYFIEDVSYEELLENIKLSKNELDKKYEKEKGLRCDFVALINGTNINIEVNNNSSIKTMERNIAYTHRLYGSKVRRDTGYNYTQVIQINLNNFSIKGNDKIIDIYAIQNGSGVRLTNKITIIQIYVPNIRKKWYTKGIESLSEAEKYILGLVEPNIEASNELGKGNAIMEEYINEAVGASQEESLLEAYDKEWAWKDEGRREGVKETNREIALKMLEKELDINLISEITGLSVEEINTLKKS